jgi:hypothetical protein
MDDSIFDSWHHWLAGWLKMHWTPQQKLRHFSDRKTANINLKKLSSFE